MTASRFWRALSALHRGACAAVRRMPSLTCDLAGFAGAGLISYGAWLIYQPAGFLVGGGLLIAFAVLFGRRVDAGKAT